MKDTVQELFRNTDYSKFISCGSATSISISVPVTQRQKCFAFKTMHETFSGQIIMDKQEWEEFLKFVGATKIDKPCNETNT